MEWLKFVMSELLYYVLTVEKWTKNSYFVCIGNVYLASGDDPKI